LRTIKNVRGEIDAPVWNAARSSGERDGGDARLDVV